MVPPFRSARIWLARDGFCSTGIASSSSTTNSRAASVTSQIDYEAGEYTKDERGTVPSTPGYTIQAQQNDGTFLSDVGVKYASTGTALTQVSGAPAIGQYSVNATGLYTFAAADAGAAVLLSYTVRPADVEQCVIEMVQFVRRSGERSGQRSKTVGNETISFITDDWPATVQCVIDRWRNPPV
jgi:hypothetical protein